MDMINLREAPMVDKPEDGAALFALNPDGTINRIKADGVGGGKIAKLRVVMPEGTESAISLQNLKDGVMTAMASVAYTATCDNMTYREAVEVIQSGEPLGVYITVADDNFFVSDYSASVLYGNGTIMIAFSGIITELANNMWYWTAGGISTQLAE